ncbi:hypothetical protein EMCRGX_G030392 [Ephydatia muelleri]
MWRLTQTKTISTAKNTSSTPASNNDKLLDQQAISAGNVAVGGEQASMGKAMIEGVQGQGQMVEQCADVTVVETGTSPSHLASSAAALKGLLVRIEGIKGEVTVMSKAACFPLSQLRKSASAGWVWLKSAARLYPYSKVGTMAEFNKHIKQMIVASDDTCFTGQGEKIN